MTSGIAALACPRRGHFDLGTGYHGDLWLDLDRLFLHPALLEPHITLLAGRLGPHRLDAVCGPLEGGAYLAWALAARMEVAFLPAERDRSRGPGSAPAYRLPAAGAGIAGWRVAIADDAVNAGTAVRACFGQLREHGGDPVAVAALLSLTPASAAAAQAMAVPFYAAETIESRAWPAGECPKCAMGTPLTTVADEPRRS